MKIYCGVCKRDNPNCNHYNNHQYRVRIHVPNTRNKVKVKVFETRDYDLAVKQAIDFKKNLILNNFETIKSQTEDNDYSLSEAILKYNQYLGGSTHWLKKRRRFQKNTRMNQYGFVNSFLKLLRSVPILID